MPDLDLFGKQVLRVAVGKAWRLCMLLRTMISLLHLNKHAFNESDEGVVAR